MLGELEYFLRSALERCAAAGASKDDIIHIYLDCNGLDFRFAHNPAGVHGTTLGSLLADNAHGLDAILERFSAMIQSGRDIFLDDKTKLMICAFSPITGGGGPTRVKSTSSKVDFFKNNKCVIQVYNPTDSTCFCRCMCIGLAKLEKMNGIPYEKMKKNCQTDMNRHLKEKAHEMHRSLGLCVNKEVTSDHMEILADRFQVQIHVFDMNGVQPEFTFYSFKGIMQIIFLSYRI